jgi:hypothetical protein
LLMSEDTAGDRRTTRLIRPRHHTPLIKRGGRKPPLSRASR